MRKARTRSGPFVFAAMGTLADREMRPRKGIQSCIDFAILLCENPRKRLLLRGMAKAAGVRSPYALAIAEPHTLNRDPMDLFQSQKKSAGPHIVCQIADRVGLRRV